MQDYQHLDHVLGMLASVLLLPIHVHNKLASDFKEGVPALLPLVDEYAVPMS